MPATYTDIPDSQIELDKPVTEPLMAALRDNPTAIAEGHDDAPRVKPRLLRMQHQRAQNVDGGTVTTGSWLTVPLNTTVVNGITGASHNTSTFQFTLPAGTYDVVSSNPCYKTSAVVHRSRLHNITDSTTLAHGTSEVSDNSTMRSIIRERITIAAAKVCELQMAVSVGQTGSGMGLASNLANPEIYAIIDIVEVG